MSVNTTLQFTKVHISLLNPKSTDSTSPFETSTQHTSAIYCTENEKCTLQAFDNRSNSNDQTPFVSLFRSPDSLSDKLHLANRRQLSNLDMFLLICMSYVHVIRLVGKSWHGQIWVTAGFVGGEKIGDFTRKEEWSWERVGKEMWPPPLKSWDLY